MKFLRPEFLYLFFSIPLILIFWFLGLKSKFKTRKIWEQSRLGDISKFSSKKREIIIGFLKLLTVAVLVFVLAGFLILYKKPPAKKPLDIVCLVDLSRSTNTGDVLWLGRKVFRLDLIKEELRSFVENYIGENKNQMALIAFGSNALPRSYFTFSASALLFHIDYLDTKDFPPEGTDIGLAILTALEILDTIDNHPELFKKPKHKRVFVLISDGEDTTEEELILSEAIAGAVRVRIPIYTIGVGSEKGGKVVEEFDEKGNEVFMMEEDEAGNETVVWSKLEERVLKRIARETGGKYVRSQTGEELSKAFEDVVEREADKEKKTEETYQDIWWYLCLTAFAFSLLIIILKQN